MALNPIERRRRRTQRGIPALVALGALALGAGVLVGRSGESEEERTAARFANALERGEYGEMYRQLTPRARARTRPDDFARGYERAMATATANRVRAGEPVGDGDVARVPLAVGTTVFGVVRGELDLPVQDGAVAWSEHLVFPGLRRGERLRRRTDPPDRARILTRDGRTLVSGPASARSPRLGEVGASIAGSVGPAEERSRRDDLYARGFPRDAPVGLTGLERALEPQVAGTPGGELLAGSRVLARSEPRRAGPVRSTIDAAVQGAAVTAIGTRLGGIAALDPLTAEVRALAGIAFSGPQPPGSTFKIVTTTAALEEGLVKTSDRFPVETKAVIDGVDLENANGESCGGTFAESFAHSCNSVFAPLGVRVGARRLVATAERYGFNARPAIPGAKPSTIPPPSEMRSPLEVGSTAIGQGKVLATPLEMASMAQVIAAGGLRYEPTLLAGERGRPDRVTSRRVARTISRLMVGVVEYGTGTSASLAPTRVAGKTGTAELENTTDPEAPSEESEPAESNTDAWFTAFAPVRRPKLAVGVLFVRAGAGGETAAPAAKQVLEAGLSQRSSRAPR